MPSSCNLVPSGVAGVRSAERSSPGGRGRLENGAEGAEEEGGGTLAGRNGGSDRAFLLKVCGLTRLEDVRLAVRHGANALGFNFHSGSPRCVTVEDARRMAADLPPDVLRVGVVVVPARSLVRTEKLKALLKRGEPFLDAFQVHGASGETDLSLFAGKLIVAVSPETAHLFPAHEIIVDTSWGSGRLGNWDDVARLNRTFILSGGLTADNVTTAIRRLRPAGVDVCSGVEVSPGRKDPAKLRSFLERAKEAGAELES